MKLSWTKWLNFWWVFCILPRKYVGFWRKVLLGEEREWETYRRNSCCIRLDVQWRETFEALHRSLRFFGLEFSCLSLSIPQFVSSISSLFVSLILLILMGSNFYIVWGLLRDHSQLQIFGFTNVKVIYSYCIRGIINLKLVYLY